MSQTQVLIRKYEKGDYDKVCKLFYDGMVENWLPAYRRIITGRAVLPTLLQLLILLIVYTFSTSFVWFLLTEFFIQVFMLLMMFYAYWAYAWEHLNSDMRDKELTYWACRGADTAGFFVATIDDEVVGTIAYLKQSKEQLEIFRLSTDKNYRKLRVASKLVAKIESVAGLLKCGEIKATTSIAQESAITFYNRNGWSEKSRSSHPGNFLHGVEHVSFIKKINADQN